jgi:hypothetical protein
MSGVGWVPDGLVRGYDPVEFEEHLAAGFSVRGNAECLSRLIQREGMGDQLAPAPSRRTGAERTK